MKKSHLSIIFIAIAIVVLFVGIFFGDIKEVYNKAIGICYECIGIG